MQPLRPYEKYDTLKQFLDHDRHVLRFYCYWDDTENMFGDQRQMVLHYFLADDTIEIREVRVTVQSGCREGVGRCVCVCVWCVCVCVCVCVCCCCLCVYVRVFYLGRESNPCCNNFSVDYS